MNKPMNEPESLLRTRWMAEPIADTRFHESVIVRDKHDHRMIAVVPPGPRQAEIAHAISLLPDLIRANADRAGRWTEYFALKAALWPDASQELPWQLTREVFRRLDEAGPNALLLDHDALPMPGREETP